jgi:hypothetical protein
MSKEKVGNWEFEISRKKGNRGTAETRSGTARRGGIAIAM